jgi:hypothetical protein
MLLLRSLSLLLLLRFGR